MSSQAEMVYRHRNAVWILCVTVIVLLSYRAFSFVTFPRLNSDSAVHILMAHDLRLPEDLYYWGQDRLGSLQPILAHGLLRLLPLTPAQAVSIVQYFFLLTGFLCFARLLKPAIAKVSLALIWFLPLTDFIAQVEPAHPYGAQFALLGGAFVLVDRLLQFARPLGHPLRLLQTGSAVLLAFASLWLSELSIVPLFWVALAAGWRYWAIGRDEWVMWNRKYLRGMGLELLTAGIAAAIGAAFILYAKRIVPGRSPGIFRALTGAELGESLGTLGRSLLNTLLFRSGSFYLGVHLLLVLALLGYLGYLLFQDGFKLRSPLSSPSARWLAVFLGSAILSFGLLVTSYWVYVNLLSLRYFVVVYLFLWLAVLLAAEQLARPHQQRVYALLLAIALVSSFTLPSFVYAIDPPDATVEKLEELNELGAAGFIGDYWQSYVLCSANPAQLKCTPHDQTMVRCQRCVEDVLSAPTIYLVKDDWRDAFPQRVTQFGQRLQKVGKPRRVADRTIVPYRVVR